MARLSTARALLLAAGLALLLAGCGQKGPLYLPDDEQAAERYGPRDATQDVEAPQRDDET